MRRTLRFLGRERLSTGGFKPVNTIARQIYLANKLKAKIAKRFTSNQISSVVFIRMTGRINRYISRRLPLI